MKKRLGFLLVALIIVVAASSLAAAVTVVPSTVYINENNNGQTIYLRVGQNLQLTLMTNPSTGYGWSYVTKPNPYVLQQTNHYLVPTGTLPGSPSTEYWIYKAVGAGSTAISLKYWRSWETGVPPLKTYGVKVVVVK
jgi:predicted secreted protein